MNRNEETTSSRPPLSVLGIEGGTTRTTAALLDDHGRVLKFIEGGPCNLALLPDAAVLRLWRKFKSEVAAATASQQAPAAVGVFLAGNRTPADAARLRRLIGKVWPQARAVVGNDSLSALAAALGSEDGVVLLCGTGTVVRARRGHRQVQVDGYGSLAGDAGSGYWMGRELLRGFLRRYDETGRLDRLGQAVLAFLGLNTLEDLVSWAADAPRDEVASLTKPLFAHSRHLLPQRIIQEAAELLADQAALAAKRAGLRAPLVALNRGLARHQPQFRRRLEAAIRQRLRGAKVFLSETEGAVGAARLALSSRGRPSIPAVQTPPAPPPVSRRGLSVALTEQRNPRTVNLDRMSVPQMIDVMLDEELRSLPRIRAQKKEITRVINWIADAIGRGGRLFYIGAGTSGRIGVLDASECPPTYGLTAEAVQGIMAGGWRALYQSLESAEDSPEDGRQVVHDRGVSRADVFVGIAASGSTPFVLGALEEAHRLGARVALLTFNPAATFTLRGSRFQRITIPTGPEVVSGSTRLKAGTATKLVLNMFSTISMVRLGKVQSNLMIGFAAKCCAKAQDRATRIYLALRPGVSYDEAWRRLEANQWDLRGLLGKS